MHCSLKFAMALNRLTGYEILLCVCQGTNKIIEHVSPVVRASQLHASSCFLIYCG